MHATENRRVRPCATEIIHFRVRVPFENADTVFRAFRKRQKVRV